MNNTVYKQALDNLNEQMGEIINEMASSPHRVRTSVHSVADAIRVKEYLERELTPAAIVVDVQAGQETLEDLKGAAKGTKGTK